MNAELRCPKCALPLESRDQSFCGECGYDLRPAPSQSPAPAPAAPPLAAALPPPPRAGRTRALYFDLGVSLAAQSRHDAAIEAFDRALAEADAAPAAEKIQRELARACEAAGNSIRAFRALLEAAPRAKPGPVLEILHGALMPDVVASHGRWIVDEWAKTVRARDVNAAIFLGHVRLFLGEHDEAFAEFSRAIRQTSADAADLARRLVLPRLPPALAAPADGPSRFARARLAEMLGDTEEAIEFAALAVGSEFPSDGAAHAAAYEMHARLLERRGEMAGAGAAYFEAGTRYNWSGKTPAALPLLRRARELRPAHAATGWHLADVLRLSEKPRDGARVWDETFAQGGPPPPDFSWTYTVRALLAEQVAWLPTTTPVAGWKLRWQGVAWMECAAALNARDAYARAYLGRFLYTVNLECCALAATRAALEIEPANPAALEEQMTALVFTGAFAEALAHSEKHFKPGASSSVDFYAAYVLTNTRDFAGAVKMLDALIGKSSDVMAHFECRAFCHENLGAREAAKADWEKILALEKPGATARGEPGIARLKLGRVAEAVTVFERLRAVSVEPPGVATLLLGLARMAAGNWDGGAAIFKTGVEECRWGWRLRGIKNLLLDPFARTAPADRVGLLGELAGFLETRARSLDEHPRDAAAELAAARQSFSARSREGVVITATQARHDAAAGRIHAAARGWLALTGRGDIFPEARRALDAALGFAAGCEATAANPLSVLPINIEMGAGLVPADTEAWPFLKTALPELRERMHGETGVELPTVNIRGNDNLQRGQYLISLHEVPTVVGTVALDTGDPFAALIAHIEATVRARLADFITHDFTARWLQLWKERDEQLVQSALPGHAARRGLVRLLRALLSEGVPVTDRAAILSAFTGTGCGAAPLATLRATRLRLRPQLPGNAPGASLLRLPEATVALLRGGLAGEGEQRRLALPPEITQQVLAEVRALIAGAPESTVLLMDDAELRTHLSFLLSIEFPRLRSIAEEELLTAPAPALAEAGPVSGVPPAAPAPVDEPPLPEIKIIFAPGCLDAMLADAAPGGDAKIFSTIREVLFWELGMKFPGFQVVTDAALPPRQFAFEIGGGRTKPHDALAAGRRFIPGDLDRVCELKIASEPSTNPYTLRACATISAGDAAAAARAGLQVLDSLGFAALHFAAALRCCAAALLPVAFVERELTRLGGSCPLLVAAVRERLHPALIARVLRDLVGEEISIRPLPLVLDALLDDSFVIAHDGEVVVLDERLAFRATPPAGWRENPLVLAIRARRALRRQTTSKLMRGAGEMIAVLLDPAIERMLTDGPLDAACVLAAVRNEISPIQASAPPTVLTNTDARLPFRELVKDEFPWLPVLAWPELPPEISIRPLSRISLPAAPAVSSE